VDSLGKETPMQEMMDMLARLVRESAWTPHSGASGDWQAKYQEAIALAKDATAVAKDKQAQIGKLEAKLKDEKLGGKKKRRVRSGLFSMETAHTVSRRKRPNGACANSTTTSGSARARRNMARRRRSTRRVSRS
jgi:hypothetical protein